MTDAIQRYLALSKGFIHEANEPLKAFEKDGKFLVLTHNIEYDNYSVIIFGGVKQLITYKYAYRTLAEAEELFEGIKGRIS